MAFYDWGLGADVMIFNLRFRTSLVKLAIQLHPVIEMSLFVFFILKVSTIFYFERYFWPRYWHFLICNLWPRCPAASFCIVSAGSLKLGGRGALRRWNLIKYWQVLSLNSMNFKILLFFNDYGWIFSQLIVAWDICTEPWNTLQPMTITNSILRWQVHKEGINSSIKTPLTRFQLILPVDSHNITKDLTGHRMHVAGPQICQINRWNNNFQIFFTVGIRRFAKKRFFG